MSRSGERPALRLAGAIVLALVQLGGGVLVTFGSAPTPRPGARFPAEMPDTIGVVEQYGDGVLVLTTMQGPLEVRVDANTIVTTPNEPAALSDILPGDKILIWGHDPARVILTGARS